MTDSYGNPHADDPGATCKPRRMPDGHLAGPVWVDGAIEYQRYQPTPRRYALDGRRVAISGRLTLVPLHAAIGLLDAVGGIYEEVVSGSTDYLVLGRDCDVAASERAVAAGVKLLDEQSFYALIRA